MEIEKMSTGGVNNGKHHKLDISKIGETFH